MNPRSDSRSGDKTMLIFFLHEVKYFEMATYNASNTKALVTV